MKNRTEEYWALVGELSQPPEALEGSVERARKRARRNLSLRRFTTPAASLAAVAATFVLLVNAFPTFALACSGVPIIRELTAAVAFSPSLSAAVAHDYVQYIGKTQTVDGVTVKLEYAIVDPVQAVFFYSVDGGQFYTSPKLTGENGEPIGGYSTSSFYAGVDQRDGLETMVLSFPGEKTSLPDRFTMELYFTPVPELNQVGTAVAPSASTLEGEPDELNPREDPNTLRFTFDIALDPARSAGKTVEVGKWLELDGQRILVNRLELYPTRTVLCLGEDPANTAWLRTLKFHFTDGKGNVYDDIDGSLSATGEEDSQSYLTYYFQSFYYGQPEHLTLHITKVEWLEKDRAHVFLDLAAGTCPGLPEGVEVSEITRTGDTVRVRLSAPLERQGIGQTFGGTYWDPEGGAHSFNRWSGSNEYDEAGNQTGYCEDIFLDGYPWDTVELELSYTSLSVYDEPVRVELF